VRTPQTAVGTRSTTRVKLAWLHSSTFKFEDIGAEAEPEVVRDPWVYIGYSTSENVYYRNLRFRSGGGVEAWLKWIPKKPALKNGRIEAWAYRLQLATIDCDDRRMTLEGTVMYSKTGKVVNSMFAGLFGNGYRTPVVPGSIGEVIWRELCRQR
jgi:hypothetical protein